MIPSGSSSSELSAVELAAWRGMLRVTHRVRRELGEELQRRHGLSMAEYDALVAVTDGGGEIRMTALSEAILQPRSSVTRIIGGLEDRGLVRRTTTPADGRGTAVALTAQGRLLYAKAHRSHLAGVRRLFLDHLEPKQLEQLAGAWSAVDPQVLATGDGRPR